MSTASFKPGSTAFVPRAKPVIERRAPLASGRDLALLGALAVGFLWFFHHFIWKQLGYRQFSWKFFDDWGHAYFVPVVSGYYLWVHRERLRIAPKGVFWPGAAPVVLGVMCYFYFTLSGDSIHMFQGASMVLTLGGMVLLLWGPRVLEVAAFPVAYLALGFTISEMVMNQLTWGLKLIASQGAFYTLTLCGVNVDLQGNVLQITRPNGLEFPPLDVADACSGMRMVVSFLALAAAVAFFGCKEWWQRILLLLLAPAIAVVVNIGRVTVLALMQFVNPNLAVGASHTLIGTLLLVPGFLLFMGALWMLRKLVRDDAPPPPPGATRSVPTRPLSVALPAFGVALALLAAGAVGMTATVKTRGIHLSKLPIEPPEGRQMHTLPTTLGRWKQVGTDEFMSAEGLEELGTRNYVTRVYRREADDPSLPPIDLQLHVAYYTGVIDTVPHVPERCLVGGGLETAGKSRIVKVPIDMTRYDTDPDADPAVHGQVLSVRTASHSRVRMPAGLADLHMSITPFRTRDDSVKLFAGYFFLANGGVVASAYDLRGQAFGLNEKYVYYAKVQFLSTGVASGEELASLAGDMLNDLLPELMQRVPDWIDVRDGVYPDPGDGAQEPQPLMRTDEP